ncbi:MAG TPA: DUF5069 domain-containing protein, partial [Vicinamibacterales bacterium]
NHAVPRRWTETLGGIRWLPRLIDKARMAKSGRLGTYLFGHSPVDIGLLRRLKITTQQFADIVAASPDDEAVLATLRERGYDEARVSRWSANLPGRHPWILGLIDREEGYVAKGPWLVPILAFRATDGFWMGLVRRVMKAP